MIKKKHNGKKGCGYSIENLHLFGKWKKIRSAIKITKANDE